MSFTPTGTGAVMRSDAGDIEDNKVTQAHIKFFKNEKEAYNYIIDNTYEDLEECTNLPRPIENFGFITEKGVLVLPTEGFNIYGEYYRNYKKRLSGRFYHIR